jgi:hypothetical protein
MRMRNLEGFSPELSLSFLTLGSLKDETKYLAGGQLATSQSQKKQKK